MRDRSTTRFGFSMPRRSQFNASVPPARNMLPSSAQAMASETSCTAAYAKGVIAILLR